MTAEQPLLPPEDDIGLLSLIVSNGFAEAVLAQLTEAGFGDARFGHGYVVQGLQAGDRTVTELAERLGISVQAVSKTVRQMEALGYIEKAPDPGDGRSMTLKLSDRALASIAESRRGRLAVQARLIAALGEERASAAIEGLRSLSAEFGGLEAIASRRVRPTAGR